ncbi:MAG: Asp-tRNA(Asn)/Glu-tRNA(Gln) amidotransferase subunit GatC [bacterium]|nr:Asp-tRNA(Asn)/Glu-tRNA(Gln) amidotransferase subunit GatC [bacterium]
MEHRVSKETIEYVSILAQLELTEEERVQAGKDMGRMLDCIDRLNELDTSGTEPVSHVIPVQNVFREDEAVNGDGREKTLQNAPKAKNGMFAVPRTFDA